MPIQLFRDWFDKHFSDPQVVILAVQVLVWSLIIIFLGEMLTPVIASVIIAYMLEGFVGIFIRYRVPRLVAVYIVFLFFLFSLFFALLSLLPLLSHQLGQLFQEVPSMIGLGQDLLMRLPERYPELFSEEQVTQIFSLVRSELTRFGQQVLSQSFASVRSAITLLVYLFLVPLSVFFMLKDKDEIIGWVTGFLPDDRTLANKVWHEVDVQIGNYIRGKVWEILIIWIASYVIFLILNLRYAILLGLFTGLSVLVPYIGVTVMFFPVALVAYLQWGLSSDFTYAVVSYAIIQLIDGNILAPLLLSEVVNLHPVAIIVAILIFGGWWGFWGLFFSIPLATLVQAILKALPRHDKEEGGTDENRLGSPAEEAEENELERE